MKEYRYEYFYVVDRNKLTKEYSNKFHLYDIEPNKIRIHIYLRQNLGNWFHGEISFWTDCSDYDTDDFYLGVIGFVILPSEDWRLSKNMDLKLFFRPDCEWSELQNQFIQCINFEDKEELLADVYIDEDIKWEQNIDRIFDSVMRKYFDAELEEKYAISSYLSSKLVEEKKRFEIE
jgi:hypothetical protein